MAAHPEKIYKCGHCGDVNESLESLKHHMVSMHMPSQETPVSSHMDTSMASTSHMDASMPSTSSGDMPSTMVTDDEQSQASMSSLDRRPGKFKCGHCGIIVSYMDDLKSHMLTQHVKDQETAKEISKIDNVPEKGD